MENNTSKPLRYSAQFISYVFHPLFVPTLFFLYLVKVVPYEFVGITEWQLKLKIFSIFWLTAFFPSFAVFLLWRLKFSESIFLRTQKERVIPYVITMFFYWWMYYLSRAFTDQPIALKYFYFGIFIASSLGLITNNFIKVSLHAIGVSGLFTAVVLAGFLYPINNFIWVGAAAMLAGVVVSARMIVSDHTKQELIVGFGIGVLTQLIAYFWVLS
jgi:hypothetical protein